MDSELPMDTRTSCIQFPCAFPVKVMGLNNDLFEPEVRLIIEKYVPVESISYARQLSSSGKYVSVTATFTAESQEQLDALYRELHANKLVLMTL